MNQFSLAMKYLFHLLLFLFSFNLNGQSIILLEEDTVSMIYEGVDISPSFIEFPLDLYYANNTEDSIIVNWRRELSENCPTEWDVFSVDVNLSYPPTVNESPFPAVMAPSDSSFLIRQSFVPRMIEGCCDLIMIFSLEGDSENPIDTGYYHIEINAEGCMTTSVSNTSLNEISLYPNPSSDYITIENDADVISIEIYDLAGKLYYSSDKGESSKIDISFLSAGIYLCNVKSNTGLWSTTKFHKK